MPVGIIITILILVIGAITLGVAITFAIHPSERKLGLIRPLSIATTFASIVGVISGLMVTFKNLAKFGGQVQASSSPMFSGLSESLIPALLGFSLLTLAWCATTLGMRKHI